jgi:DNA-binding transcriptional LysR family regulator
VDLELLRTVVAIHRTGTLTAAAAALGRSQPTVTAQLRSLERQLGQQLFERAPRGVVPTAVADELVARVAPHVDALARVAERGSGSGDRSGRPVHLAGPAELTAVRVLPALAPLVRGGLRLRVTVGLADDLLTGLSAARFDLVVATVRPRGRETRAVPLTDEEFVLVAGTEWTARIDRDRVARLGAAALRDVPLVAYAEDLPIVRRYWRAVFGTRPPGPAAVVVADLRAVLAATVAGAGATVLPRYLCADALASGALVALHEPEVPPINTLFLASRSGAEDEPGVAAVRRHLLTAAREW